MSKEHYILALDTALGPCGVAVIDAENNGASQIRPTEREQAQILVPMVEQVLSDAGVSYQDLSAIVTTVGPGSFTGLRISLSAARAFGLALNIPVIGISTLDALAAQILSQNEIEDNQTLCIVIETKRADYYAGFYNGAGEEVAKPVCCDALEILYQAHDKIDILAGNATARFLKELGGNAIKVGGVIAADSIDIEFLARLAFEPSFHRPPEPLYLRGADISKPKRKQRALSE